MKIGKTILKNKNENRNIYTPQIFHKPIVIMNT